MVDSVQRRTWPHGWNIDSANSLRARTVGLLDRKELPDRGGLWLKSRSVHTVGMSFAIDLVWLDQNGLPIAVDQNVVPFRIRTCMRASGGVVEVAAGQGVKLARSFLRDRGFYGPVARGLDCECERPE